MKTIRWVLAHEPIELFLRAAKRFKKTMEEMAPGVLDYEIMTLSENSDKIRMVRKLQNMILWTSWKQERLRCLKCIHPHLVVSIIETYGH